MRDVRTEEDLERRLTLRERARERRGPEHLRSDEELVVEAADAGRRRERSSVPSCVPPKLSSRPRYMTPMRAAYANGPMSPATRIRGATRTLSSPV